jgi:hypothetical protein
MVLILVKYPNTPTTENNTCKEKNHQYTFLSCSKANKFTSELIVTADNSL